jgi:CheY-like chemotaxis protein
MTILPNQKTIFLVEDNLGDVVLIRETLQEIDSMLEVLVYPGIDELIEGLHELRERVLVSSGIILLDLNLPRCSGIEILKWFKKDPVLRLQPVLIWTSSRSPSDVEQAFAHGANAYIPKPDDLEGYRVAMRSLVEFWLRVSILPAAPLANRFPTNLKGEL